MNSYLPILQFFVLFHLVPRAAGWSGGAFHSNEPGNICSLGSNEEIQPQGLNSLANNPSRLTSI